MIMRSGQQLLLPVNSWFIWGSLVVALMLNVLISALFGRAAWPPDILALVLVFWVIHQPLRIGVGTAFVFGLFMDVHQGALLGQHALAYTALSFFCHHDLPPPPLVFRPLAGIANAAAALWRAWRATAGAHARRQQLSRLEFCALAVYRGCALARCDFDPARAANACARPGCQQAFVKTFAAGGRK